MVNTKKIALVMSILGLVALIGALMPAPVAKACRISLITCSCSTHDDTTNPRSASPEIPVSDVSGLGDLELTRLFAGP